MNTDNISIVLLAFIPALLNAGVIFYIFLFLPKSRTTNIFTCYVFALLIWQTEDTILRLATSEASARYFDTVFCFGWQAMTPLAFHFACHYAGLKKFCSRLAVFLIYSPFIIYYVMYMADNATITFYQDSVWGWLGAARPRSLDEMHRYLMSIMMIGAVFVLTRHAARIRNHKEKKYQAWLIAIGVLIPSLQGITTQVIFPLILVIPEIPLTSTFMTFFSIGTLIALRKYKSLNIAESIQSDILLEQLNNFVFIVSPDKKVIYSNQNASQVFGLKGQDREAIPFELLFPAKEKFEQYRSSVFDKVMQGEQSDNFTAVLRTPANKNIDVLITSRLVINNKVVQGVLLVANDITERVNILRELEEVRLRKEKEITEAVLAAQEKERRSIGIELHDNVNQILASSLLYINMLKNTGQSTHPYLSDAEELVNSAVTEIRNLSHNMIGPSMDDKELSQALIKIFDTTSMMGTITVEKEMKLNEKLISEKLKLNIYRIVQEQFNNIIKYAHANRIKLKLVHQENKLMLSIKDDGVGFDTNTRSDGVGIMNMKTRASLNNGKMQIVSSPGQGCELIVLFDNISSKTA